MYFNFGESLLENSLSHIFEDNFFNYPYQCNIKCNKTPTYIYTYSFSYNNNSYIPNINISEDEKHYYLQVELPGMTKDQIKMEINEDRILTIAGERKSIDSKNKDKNENPSTSNENGNEESNKNNKNNNRKYTLKESNYGKFERSFNVPEDGDLETIQAKMENGLLEVTINKILPKNETRNIQIQ
ncbi:HSP20-like chaperone [Anaeromyces robustus]|uniref:HSP20-like chaperone n=1 Tax=Anaeromyces robustus TaxID=1754192 RepID=A0A1Y1X4A4_9FUNG|nr:HSP20-like chaperone [Anaeromyces robustus]|eukprot:ORX80196.1 HSP20-like chaperone [Anaeromyces robustus]